MRLYHLSFHKTRAAAVAGVSGPIVFAVVTLAAHLLRPGYDWISQTISILALGEKGWVQALGFFLFGSLVIVFAMGLYSGINRRKGLRASVTMIILGGIGFMLIAIFPTDVPGEPLSFHNLVHQGAVRVITALFPFSCFSLIPSLRGDPRWRGLTAYTAVTGILALSLDLLWVAIPHEILHLWEGLYERLLTANSLAWMEVMGLRLLAVPPPVPIASGRRT